jgi:hypothetical protein
MRMYRALEVWKHSSAAPQEHTYSHGHNTVYHYSVTLPSYGQSRPSAGAQSQGTFLKSGKPAPAPKPWKPGR